MSFSHAGVHVASSPVKSPRHRSLYAQQQPIVKYAKNLDTKWSLKKENKNNRQKSSSPSPRSSPSPFSSTTSSYGAQHNLPKQLQLSLWDTITSLEARDDLKQDYYARLDESQREKHEEKLYKEYVKHLFHEKQLKHLYRSKQRRKMLELLSGLRNSAHHHDSVDVNTSKFQQLIDVDDKDEWNHVFFGKHNVINQNKLKQHELHASHHNELIERNKQNAIESIQRKHDNEYEMKQIDKYEKQMKINEIKHHEDMLRDLNHRKRDYIASHFSHPRVQNVVQHTQYLLSSRCTTRPTSACPTTIESERRAFGTVSKIQHRANQKLLESYEEKETERDRPRSSRSISPSLSTLNTIRSASPHLYLSHPTRTSSPRSATSRSSTPLTQRLKQLSLPLSRLVNEPPVTHEHREFNGLRHEPKLNKHEIMDAHLLQHQQNNPPEALSSRPDSALSSRPGTSSGPTTAIAPSEVHVQPTPPSTARKGTKQRPPAKIVNEFTKQNSRKFDGPDSSRSTSQSQSQSHPPTFITLPDSTPLSTSRTSSHYSQAPTLETIYSPDNRRAVSAPGTARSNFDSASLSPSPPATDRSESSYAIRNKAFLSARFRPLSRLCQQNPSLPMFLSVNPYEHCIGQLQS